MIGDFISAIEYAIKNDSPDLFLEIWMEGDWMTLKNEWSDFILPLCAEPQLKLVDECVLVDETLEKQLSEIDEGTGSNDGCS